MYRDDYRYYSVRVTGKGDLHMSTLSAVNCAFAEIVFDMEQGYVLNFTNATFKNFVLRSIGIDVEDDPKYKAGGSKARKLRQIIRDESDAKVGKLLLDLLKYRDSRILALKEVDDEYVDKNSSDAEELKRAAELLCSGAQAFASNDERLKENILNANSFIQDLIPVIESLCNNPDYNQSSEEDQITRYIRDLLKARGYKQTNDQTQHGQSENGKKAGEVDLLIWEKNREFALIEALKLSCVNKASISKHIDKAIVNYNALGTTTYILAYVTASNFGGFWDKCFEYLSHYDFPVEVRKAATELIQPNAATKIAKFILRKNGYDFPMFFIAVNMRN